MNINDSPQREIFKHKCRCSLHYFFIGFYLAMLFFYLFQMLNQQKFNVIGHGMVFVAKTPILSKILSDRRKVNTHLLVGISLPSHSRDKCMKNQYICFRQE